MTAADHLATGPQAPWLPLGANRDRADAFAAAWARHVRGGELTSTRTEAGRRAVLEARAAPFRYARSYAFDRWR